MKKRLLISSALMTAVLACALGTGTYAWYTVNAGSNTPTATSVSANVGVLAPVVTVNNLTFTFSITGTDVDTSDGIKLADVDLTNAQGKSKYYVNDSTIPEYQAQKTSGSFKVDVTLSLTDPNVLAMYAGTYNFEVTSNGYARVASTSETVFFSDLTNDKVTFTVTISAAGAVTNSGVTVYYSVAAKEESKSESASDHTADGITVSYVGKAA